MTKLRLLIALVLFIAGMAVGAAAVFFFRRATAAPSPALVLDTVKLLRDPSPALPLINPLIDIRFDQKQDFTEYLPLENDINSIITGNQKQNAIDRASVYVRDMNTGRWTGINEEDKYAPASLFKVGVLMAYLKLAETDPSVLSKKMLFPGYGTPEASRGDAPPDKELVKGQQYTVEQLLTQLMIYSDNDADQVLIRNIDQGYLSQVYVDMHLPLPTDPNAQNFVSARSYSLFFRALYNSTYLNEALSEKALQLMTEATFQKGLLPGVPSTVTVSHKYGIYAKPVTGSAPQTYELHDCGIVYVPSSPYFVCVMTEGKNVTQEEAFIQQVSKTVYAEMTAIDK